MLVPRGSPSDLNSVRAALTALVVTGTNVITRIGRLLFGGCLPALALFEPFIDSAYSCTYNLLYSSFKVILSGEIKSNVLIVNISIKYITCISESCYFAGILSSEPQKRIMIP